MASLILALGPIFLADPVVYAHDLFLVEYRFSAELAGVNVTTTGWVGFGISPNGQMPGSDVIIGWVNDGSATFHDQYAFDRVQPSIDESQDWILQTGKEEDGQTILEFSRPFRSCDTENDLDIKVTIPSDTTTYWCKVHALPEKASQQEIYVYKVSPVISEFNYPFVHHILVYLCNNLNNSHVGTSTECNRASIDISLCRYRTVVFVAWAVGGNDFVFPEDVAYPIGGKDKQFMVLEMHYDNPNRVEGVVDNSGLELFYVNGEPKHRAGLLPLGASSASNLIIPPRARNFVVNALCPGQCTKKFFPSDGIDIFGNFLHTHLAGHGLIVKHFRENVECGGTKELEPIDENRRYDFYYQQSTILPRVVHVLPGDILQLQCMYQTTDSKYQGVTLGRGSTHEEMCFTFLYYFPETALAYCIGFQSPTVEFTSQYLSKKDEKTLAMSIQKNDHHSMESILNKVEWNQQSIDSFQNSVQSNLLISVCSNATDIRDRTIDGSTLPHSTCPFKPENMCSSNNNQESISGAKNLIFIFYVSIFTLVQLNSKFPCTKITPVWKCYY